MSQTTTAAQQVLVACPNCGKGYRIPANRIGGKAKCSCQTVFELRPAAPPPQAAAGVCPICQSAPAAGEQLVACPHCSAVHHKDCWEYNGGCSKYGCPSAPATDKLREIEIPASYWGQTEKNCPCCGQVIQAAAVRCRNCGATFKSARPQHELEFRDQLMTKAKLPSLRKTAIFLLIFSIIPFTAPVAAIIALIWYAANRRAIAELPAQEAALPKIAIIIGGAVTALVVVALVLFAIRS